MKSVETRLTQILYKIALCGRRNKRNKKRKGGMTAKQYYGLLVDSFEIYLKSFISTLSIISHKKQSGAWEVKIIEKKT